MKLVIIESPNKCKSIQAALGRDWKVISSFGHFLTLNRKNGVDTNNNFHLNFVIDGNKDRIVNEIIKQAKQATEIYLATDPDREGEAIAYHIQDVITQKGIHKPTYRVRFNATTPDVVRKAFQNPTQLNQNLVNAQLARRTLDYLIGFYLSPILWSKVGPKTSAGRVQSPGLRMISERENDIKAFNVEEYWSVWLNTFVQTPEKRVEFKAKLIKYLGKVINKNPIRTQAEAEEIKSQLLRCKARVSKIDVKSYNRKPLPPFTTSTLQQEAARKLGYTANRTMSIAQSLFERVEKYDHGIITYMRTDSITMSDEAMTALRSYIPKAYGDKALPAKVNVYNKKNKNAQEAHECIRPTDFEITPNDIKDHVSPEIYKLYKLIWERTVASQMHDAVYMNTVATIEMDDKAEMQASGRVLISAGFLEVYKDTQKESDDESQELPMITAGMELPVQDIDTNQHFTKPPPRFNESSFIKSLEDIGIGRPSTYATIVTTLKDREYIATNDKRYTISDKGYLIVKYLTEKFPEYVDYEFTSKMEDDLDRIANGELDYLEFLHQFWNNFQKKVQEEKSSDTNRMHLDILDEDCPVCNSKLVVRVSKYGRYIGCSNYPSCKYIRSDNNKPKAEVVPDRKCPECQSDLVKRKGFKGAEFIGCSNYPNCKYVDGREPPKDTGITCPKCKKHNLVIRKTRYGVMTACSGFPKCRYVQKDNQETHYKPSKRKSKSFKK